ncbi:tRNA nucleotidyltransferase (cca) [Methanocaldococcus jannaschii DSM 2661]|uniref:CCA-adding enzyme n=1 Tax=Methanocaldococcus jannaschii (strain ATCC 43067 / DSM 2661 / JAL-1 / JCM 10045 / NBRC 100440) TaxID=243232 RepID=CCA_METJA|nr:CCA tRNA nucleotidyltransferase [Methanocaldococcus jannaschii]Q58511.2 RecName: Full=CCA-adding enzyme; AltName: Full=CCA tRNA nucleotidyltransferase; AltName: Full=tRNA CCA-pyrophosphorylase; AltName: Full=tRNA adenylyl-/cytidylyl- transferase; AltName: Full=tRNA nucleotidyltransferase; AltName: Full=tRNA-NT [Methanocaldococcus jannaschii DSM 2661]AAB99114.1 tRNA nucleotidyltransferase (cca) [Methanocaldococcus jannaschii DSM 2661]
MIVLTIEEILKEVLNEIKPSKEDMEKLQLKANEIIDKIWEIVRENSYPILEVLLVGSSARNTNLKDDYDIDIFVLFDKSVSEDELEEIGLKIGTEAIKRLNGSYNINYASHPYVNGEVDGYEVDIVPCYKIDFGEKIISAVDRTPLHHKFLISRLNERLCDEVRLLKAFLKSLGLYGSDVKTKGFSGYLCELLILHYGSFINLLKEAQNWRIGKKIILKDIFEIYKDVDINKLKKFDEPFIVYDPVDLNRNVASPLSKDNFCRFIFYSRQFLKNPSIEFFKDYAKKLEEILENREHGYRLILKIPRENVVDDIIYPQMEKLQKSINKVIVKNEFVILNSKCFADDNYCYLYWEFLVYELPKIALREGPPVFEKERAERFLKKYGKVFIRDCKLFAYTEREYSHIIDLFKDIVNGNLQNISIPKYVNPRNGKIIELNSHGEHKQFNKECQ